MIVNNMKGLNGEHYAQIFSFVGSWIALVMIVAPRSPRLCFQANLQKVQRLGGFTGAEGGEPE